MSYCAAVLAGLSPKYFLRMARRICFASSCALAAISLPVSAQLLSNSVPIASFVAPKQPRLTNDPICAPGTTNVLRAQPAGTRRMVERLTKIREETDPKRNQFLNVELAEIYRAALSRAVTPKEILAVQPMLALQLLQSGQSQAALEAFEAYKQTIRQSGQHLSSQQAGVIDVYRAICSLRIGEQENCLSNHTSASCLLPITAEGVHKGASGNSGTNR